MSSIKNQVREILDKKLYNNDIHIIDEILSFLDTCDICGKLDKCDRYVVTCDIKFINIYDMCHPCMVNKMINHISGRRGVIPIDEWWNHEYNYVKQ